MSYFKPASVVGGGMLLAVVLASIAVAQEPTSRRQAFREIYQELVEINTTNSVGDSLRAAEAMAARLKAGGLAPDNVQVLSSAPRKGNLVARLGGNGLRKPILLIAHLDVVEAKREDWDFDPFKLQEINGYFRGRGSIDDKAMASIFVANLIEYVKEGFQPDRDIILALTADEELSDSPHDGAHFLLDHHRALIEAEFAINEGGGGALRDGKPFRMNVQHAEKVYQTYMLEVTDPGGHSASGRRDNAIYCRGLAPPRSIRFPGWAQCGDARLFREHGIRGSAVDGRCDAGAAGRPHRRRGTKAAHPPSRVQRGNAHHLRCDAPRGRPCRERAAAKRPRHRKLPRSTGSVGCGSRARAQPRDLGRESQGHPQGPSGPKPCVANQPRNHARG